MSCAGGNNTKTLITSVAAAAGQLALHVHICIATSVHYELGRFSLGVLDATLTAMHAPQSLKTKASLPFKLHSAGFFSPLFYFQIQLENSCVRERDCICEDRGGNPPKSAAISMLKRSHRLVEGDRPTFLV